MCKNKKGAMRTDQSTAKAPKASVKKDYNYISTDNAVLSRDTREKR